jgi:hypothetical protein
VSLRKTAAFLAVSGLIIGLLGSGVGASFFDQVTGTENISVGSFSCYVSDATDGAVFGSYTAGHPHSVTYTAPKILDSAPGSAPFTFTVRNAGDIAMNLHVSANVNWTTATTFTSMPVYDQVINPSEDWQFQEGLSWPELVNADLGKSASVTYTVACDDVTAPTVFGPATISESSGTYTIVSTGTTYSMYGVAPDWGGIAIPNQGGKLLSALNLSFDDTGSHIGAGTPRWSIPVSEDGTTFTGKYAFIGANTCSTTTVGTVATCTVDYSGYPSSDWATFVAAHPTWSVAPGFDPLIVADGENGTYVIASVSY